LPDGEFVFAASQLLHEVLPFVEAAAKAKLVTQN
jgi:hypothetical protein